MKKTYITLTPIALVATMMMSQAYADHTVLHDVVVTATPMTSPLTMEMDPKVPRQPLPAHDGADFLKSVPGFSIMRKAGADGEPNFRGMGGSRVNILADDQNIFGGCGQRMDAPTAYIFPEIYDKVTVVKGPQTVLYPGHGSAATVRFEKEQKVYDKPGYDVHASGLIGSFGRHDEVVDANIGNKDYFATFTGSNSKSDDYKDGDGNKVHSKYHRYSASSSFGVTPDNNKRFEVSASRSNGYAAYADRTLDGTKFLRENVAAKGQVKNISDLVEKIEFQIGRNFVDHIMEDGVLRPYSVGGMSVDHLTYSGRLVADLKLNTSIKGKVGYDFSTSTHSSSAMNTRIFTDDAEFTNNGIFAQIEQQLSSKDKVIYGYRFDSWGAKDKRSSVDTAGKERNEIANSGFARLEKAMESIPNAVGYIGFGHSERFPDYWELISARRNAGAAFGDMGGMRSSFISTKSEKTNQLDLGLIHKSSNVDFGASIFVNKINDFILIDSTTDYYTSSQHGAYSSARNIDARTYGGELTASYMLTNVIKLNSSINYVKGKNETDNLPLAQVAPLEGRFAVAYDDKVYSYGALLRLVAPKNDFALNQGNISGKDLGKSGGFGIFSLNAGYKPSKKTFIAAGVDNLFDKTYAEFISRSASSASTGGIAGYVPSFRVNEPGRTAWLKATIALD